MYWISAVAMARRLFRGETRRRCAGHRYRAEPGRGWEQARKEHGLTNLKFQEGDASNLEQVPDKRFDLVVSIFGAMFAPKPFDVPKRWCA